MKVETQQERSQKHLQFQNNNNNKMMNPSHCKLFSMISAAAAILEIFLVLATPVQYYYADRRYEYRCADLQTGREVYVGEAFYRHGQCIRVQCLDDLSLWEDRCNIPKLDGICSEIPPANEYLDYPKCCPLYECKIHTHDNGDSEETRVYDHYGNLKRTRITQVFVISEPFGGGGSDINGTRMKAQFGI